MNNGNGIIRMVDSNLAHLSRSVSTEQAVLSWGINKRESRLILRSLFCFKHQEMSCNKRIYEGIPCLLPQTCKRQTSLFIC